ncbi:MAG TPA: mechanosensitive ion channel [Candidatus Aphodomonas merdavium]|nr:mechanosensitive ion channel [Candidatus Aphodomonas merdavium]
MAQVITALQHVGVDKLLIALAVLLACLIAVRYIMKLFDRFLKKASRIDPSLHSIVRTALRCMLILLSIMFAANLAGIAITSFLALFSIIGLAISLAVQDVLTNFTGGIIILGSKPFTLGDFIETDTVTGTVEEISFLYTRLRSADGKMIFIPNKHLYTSNLTNFTSSGARRIELTVSASYENTPEQVRAAAMQAIAATGNVLADPAPEVLLEAYGDSAISYTIRAWAAPGAYGCTRYALNEALYTAFLHAGVDMTYPHLNVHLHQGDGSGT